MTYLLPNKLRPLPLTYHQIPPAIPPRLAPWGLAPWTTPQSNRNRNRNPRIQDMDLHLQGAYLGIQGLHNHPQDTDHPLPGIDSLQGTGLTQGMDYPLPDLGCRRPDMYHLQDTGRPRDMDCPHPDSGCPLPAFEFLQGTDLPRAMAYLPRCLDSLLLDMVRLPDSQTPLLALPRDVTIHLHLKMRPSGPTLINV